MTAYWQSSDVTVYRGDCLDVLADMDECTVDAVVTDPPYGLEFMGKDWDRPWAVGMSKPGYSDADRQARPSFGDNRNANCQTCGGRQRGANRCACDQPTWDRHPREDMRAYQQWCQTWAEQCLRVLKPGGHLLAFGGTRTYHRLTCAIEDAGFEIRDCIAWMYGVGFPKSSNPYRSIMGSLCRSHANAPHAVRLSPHIQAASNGAKTPTALELALIQPGDEPVLLTATGEADGSNGLTAISPSALGATTSLSIDLSWSADWADRWRLMSTSITETVTRLTTDPETWSFFRSLPTPPTITPDGFRPDGCECSVVHVAERSSDGSPRWRPTPLLIATGTVTGPLAGLEGLGTAAKPAFEPIVVARKPLAGTVAANVVEWGTGALNIDGCRVQTDDSLGGGANAAMTRDTRADGWGRPWMDDDASRDAAAVRSRESTEHAETLGRWPANVVLDETAADMLDQQTGTLTSGSRAEGVRKGLGYHGANGDGGPAIEGNNGGPSRFFYCAKASPEERRHSTHPTQKPVELMRWLIRLVTPPDGGVVLDPFAGSGTTGVAAVIEGRRCILIERDAEYAAIIHARLGQPIQPVLGL